MIEAGIRLAHLGFYDAAPLLAAESCGYFDTENLQVQIVRELGMASIAAGLSEGGLTGAIVPAQTPLILSLGMGRTRTATRVLAQTSTQGMVVVLSTRLPDAFPTLPKAGAMPPLKLGVISPESPGKFFISRWWRGLAADGGREPVCIPVAATQLVDFMLDGVIDGFCGPDPLGLVTQLNGSGRVVATSADLHPGHPGSVLVVREQLYRHEPHTCRALARALVRGRKHCADPAAHQSLLAPMLGDFMSVDDGTDIPASLAALMRTPGCPKPSINFDFQGDDARPVAAGVEFISQAVRYEVNPGARSRDFSAEIIRLCHPVATAEDVAFPRPVPAVATTGRKAGGAI